MQQAGLCPLFDFRLVVIKMAFILIHCDIICYEFMVCIDIILFAYI